MKYLLLILLLISNNLYAITAKEARKQSEHNQTIIDKENLRECFKEIYDNINESIKNGNTYVATVDEICTESNRKAIVKKLLKEGFTVDERFGYLIISW